MSRRYVLALITSICLSSSAATAGAYAPPATDALAVELHRLAHDKQSHFVEPSTKRTWGRAQIFVDAPMKDVRAAITDYGAWGASIPRFKKTKVLARSAAGTDVYLQMPVVNGAVTLWAVERFAAPVVVGKGERIAGTFVKGNLEDLQAIWHFRPVDEAHTLVTLEIYLQPNMAVPESIMVSQREQACGEAAVGIRNRAQALARGAKTP